MHTPPASWSSFRLFCFRAFLLFVILFIISFSFGYHLLPAPGNTLDGFWESLARFTGDHLFHLRQPYPAGLVSDSTVFYINAFNILIVSLLLAFIWGIVFRKIRSHNQLRYWFTVTVRYYLALQLFIYGFSKVFKAQFYLPEPNILYTTLGNVPKDLLYWSTMGVSRPYTIFLGLAEVLTASLLLFRRTTLAGAFVCTFIMINVTAINFAYDISVKLLSCFLLLLAAYLLSVHGKRITRFFAGQPTEPLKRRTPVLQPRQQWMYRFAKVFLIVTILLESLWVYIRTNNFNDDLAPRPILHGAYYVDDFILNGDTLPPLLTDTVRWKRVFFHRQGYFITEKMNDDMLDYKMEYDLTANDIYITPYRASTPIILSWQQPDTATLLLEGTTGPNKLKLVLHQLDWRQLPVLKKEFNWTVD
jgi:uncharacterized membrane protein YphA (DoxX/SURF4 family)